MKLQTIQGILLGAIIGIAVGIGAYTLRMPRVVLPDRQPGGLRQLPRHARTIRRLAQVVAPRGRDLQQCHTPADFIGKYATKASNGFWHSFYFTTGGYEDNIQIRPHSREITEQACRKCHEEIVGAIEAAHPAAGRRASSPVSAVTTRWDTCIDEATHTGTRTFEEDPMAETIDSDASTRRRRRRFLCHRGRGRACDHRRRRAC